MGAVAAWLQQTRRTYFDNAASVRDYRVQLRGNRSVILFGIYLFVLIAVAMTVYSELAGGSSISVVDAQRRLRDFYGVVTALLGGIVSLVAPALTATSIVMERQRRSLDLIFSAPVTPKYYLVGKMLASFRYTWMLLVLALPVTAACVVLGGASWTDVLVTYLALSMQALVFTAMALLMSTLSPKPVSAVVWSYACAIAFLIVTAMAAAAASIGSYSGRTTQEAPFFSAMNPFLLAYSVNTHTLVGTTEVPNWIFTILLSLLICKLCLLGAGTLLSAQPARELRSLRLHFLFYLAALVMYLGWENSSTTVAAGPIVFWALFPLLLVMPFLSTFGVDAERRYRPNGWFSIKHTLDGTPAGGLPYVVVLIGACLIAAIAGEWFGQGRKQPLGTLAYVLYIFGFWGMFWAIGRFAASTFVGLRSARMLQFAAFVLIVFLPVPFFASIASSSSFGSSSSVNSGIWDFYILRPFFTPFATGETIAAVYGIILLFLGTLIGLAAERNVRRRLPPERLAHERTLASS